jgi:hypothetical protein
VHEGLQVLYRTAAPLEVNSDADTITHIIANDAQGEVGGNGARVEGGIFSD